MDELMILRTFAAVTTVLAASLVAANLNAPVTVAGFMMFIVASIAWMIDGWLEGNASLVIQNVILLVINVIGVWRWVPKAEKEAKARGSLFAKPVATQKRLIDRDGGLCAFRYGDSDKKDVTRHVTRDINAGNAAFLRGGINDHTPFLITLAAQAV